MTKDVLRHIYRYAWVLLAFLTVFSACDRIEDDLVFSDEVKLTASLSPALSTVYTKGVGEIKSTHAGELEIGVAKTFTETMGGVETYNFNNAQNTQTLRAVMGAPSVDNLGLRDIKFDDFQGYPDASTELNYIAWYPYAGSTYDNPTTGNSTVSFNIPTDASTDILYSDVASGTRLSGFNTMTFQHALVKYTIKVYAMESDESAGSVSDVWGKIKSVTLEGMPSTCVLNLPTASERTSDVTFTDTPAADLQRNAPEGFDKIPVGFSKAAELTYFLAPPPSNAENVLNIKVITEKSASGKNAETSIARDFQPGKHYQIYLRFTTHGIISAEVVAGEWTDSHDFLHVDSNQGMYYNLSESHSSNSYMVSAAYNYCFDATVRGNGYTGVAAIPGADPDIYKLGEPVTTEIIWTDLVSATNENLDDIITVLPKVVEGHVFFEVHPKVLGGHALKKEGNIVIGVKDKVGNLLWAWHIWLTDRPAEQGYKNGFAVQDRDLGATAYNAETEPNGINGLFYQWGRPTPLPLGKTVYKPNYDTNGVWTSNTAVTFTASDDVVPIIDRVKSPTVYFNAKATASDKTITKSLWGWRTQTDEYAKSIYDPCPPGYRVPSIKLWRDLVIEDENKDGKHDAHIVGDNVATKFKVDVNHTVVYYPMTGYYTSLTENPRMDKGAYMWAATFELGALNNLEDDAPYGLGFRIDEVDSSNELNEMTLEAVPSNIAMPVRCISRMSKAHVTDLSDYQTANSYMVSKKGFYKFKATVRGNGVGLLVAPGETSTIVLTEQLKTVDIKSQLVAVEPLWWQPAAGTSIVRPEISLQNNGVPDADGYVTFELETFHEGNLILAGYDAKGEIIWSWHLWFTEDPAMMKSNSFVVMDRNLGATHAPTGTAEPTGNSLNETYGFYYQWGRKDPFVVENSVVYEYKDGVYTPITAFSGTSSFKKQNDAASKTVENSVKKPMTFHLATNPQSSGIFNNNDFFSSYSVSEEDNALENQCFSNLVYPDNKKSFWGYSAATGYGVTTTKTMYDPCPPGYIAAHYLIWTNTERNGDSSVNYYSNLDTGWKYHNIGGTGGFFTTEYDTLFDPAWYPFAGYINGKDGKLYKQGNMGIIHTSTPAGLGSRSLAYNATYSGQIVDHSYRGLPSTFAYPVRCQKE